MVKLAIITFDDPDPEALEAFSETLVRDIRDYIRRHTKMSSGKLEDSIRASVAGKVIVVDADSVYAKVVDKGSAARQLWSLINKVVPIELDSGVTIFRRVTAKQLGMGKWTIPAKHGINFVARGAEAAVARHPELKGMNIYSPDMMPLREIFMEG